MDSFELNKILGAVLGTCLVLLVTELHRQRAVRAVEPEKPGFDIAVKEEAERRRQGGGRGRPSEPIEKLLQTASVEKGAGRRQEVRRLPHLRKGGPNRVGPNLYGVVGATRAQAAGFNFSAAHEGQGRQLDLSTSSTSSSPIRRVIVPGTAMGFAGIPKDSERADVIAYLHTLSDIRRRCRRRRNSRSGVRQRRTHACCFERRPGLAWPFSHSGASRGCYRDVSPHTTGSRAWYHEEKPTLPVESLPYIAS